MNRKIALRLAAVPAAVLASLGTAHAALPTEVSSAITEAGANLALAGTAIIAALAAFWGLKKLGSKLGLW